MPENFRRATFERVLYTDWEGAREKPVADTTGCFVANLSVASGARVLLVFNLVNHAPPLPTWRTKLDLTFFEFNQALTFKAILSVCSEA